MIDLYYYVLVPVLLATIILMWIPYAIFKRIALATEIVLLVMAMLLFREVKTGGPVVQTIGGWNSYVGITLRADLLTCSLLLLTVILFTCAILFNYKTPYVDKRFLFLLITWQGLISGIFLSNDLFNIYILIEVCTIIVSMLIVYKKEKRSVYDSMVYLLLNITSALFILMGIGYLYKTVGVFDFYGIAEKVKLLDDPRPLILPYSFIMTGVCLKAALMPLFGWLPKAHGTPGAPSIVSAILSGLYVKSGLYLFIRMQEAFAGTLDTANFFMVIGFLTGVLGFFLAICQYDIKLILAYSTVSQIGLIMMGLTSTSAPAYWGGVYHIINHALFKSLLFLTAGIIIDTYNIRDIRKIRGVLRKEPVVGIATILAMFGITGAPFFNGSISKYFIQEGYKNYLSYGLFVINLGTIVSFIKFSAILFGKHTGEKIKTNIYLKSVIIALGVGCFLGGIFGQRLVGFLFNQYLSLDFSIYLQKTLIFFAHLAAGLLIYFFVITRTKILYRIGRHEMGFNNTCLAIVIFFASLVVYLTFKYTILPV